MSNFIIPTDGLQEKFEKAQEEFLRSVKSPNVLLLGQTGVGKSTLVNTIFGEELAAVSHVKPETKDYVIYNSPNTHVNIIDSMGYELGNPEEFKTSFENFINKNFDEATKQIHICWYCISISSARILPYDIDNIRYLLKEKRIPTCVVFTQCDNDTPEGDVARQLKNVIVENFGDSVPCFQTSNDEELNKNLDIEKLIQWSADNINDDNLKAGFIISQKKNLALMEDKASSIIKYYVGAAAAIGASPIPMSDAILLTELQTEMAADIFAIFGLNNSTSSTLKNVISSKVVSKIGKSLARNLLKLIPGLGSIGGALKNAGVASSITGAMGYALVKSSKIAIEKSFEGQTELVEELFTSEKIDQFIEEYKKMSK